MVGRVEDARAAITHLIYSYADRVDRGDFEGVADLLADADVTLGKSVLQGREKVLARYMRTTRRYPDDGTPKTHHVTTNLLIDVDEEAGVGSCQSYFTVLQAIPGVLALQPIIAGRYRDDFARVEGVWRFASRKMFVDLVGDLSQHLTVNPLV